MIIQTILVLVVGLLPAYSFAESDMVIRTKIVSQSISSYRGNCPCPEFRDRAGRRCGKRSAYYRAGGESPLCYPSDVTPAMIQRYKERQN